MLLELIANLSFISWKKTYIVLHFCKCSFITQLVLRTFFLFAVCCSDQHFPWIVYFSLKKCFCSSHTFFLFCLPNLDCKLWTSMCSLARIWRAPQSRGVRYWKIIISIFVYFVSIKIIGLYFAECVIVLISDYSGQMQCLIFFIFCVVRSHQRFNSSFHLSLNRVLPFNQAIFFLKVCIFWVKLLHLISQLR